MFGLAFFGSRHAHWGPSHSDGLVLEKHFLPTELEDGLGLSFKEWFASIYLCFTVTYFHFAGFKVSIEASLIPKATTVLENYHSRGRAISRNITSDWQLNCFLTQFLSVPFVILRASSLGDNLWGQHVPRTTVVDSLKEPPYFGTERFNCTHRCLSVVPGLRANRRPHPTENL